VAVKRVLPSVASVDRLEQYYDFWQEGVGIAQTGTGSGVVISAQGHVLTNHHVVAGAHSVQVRLADGRTLAARIIGTDPRSDLAVLKVEASDLVPAELGDSSKLEIGEWVLAIGNPLGYENTVSVGVVSSLNRTIEEQGSGLLVDAVQTDAAINSGNSGGALANAAGQVVGINSAIVTPTGGSVGLGFAIPINRAKRVVADILKDGRVQYGDLGATFYRRPDLLLLTSARQQLREATGAEPPQSGIVVRSTLPESAAKSAGLRPLDVIVEVDGKKVERALDLQKALFDKRVGDRVQLRYWTRGQLKSATVTLR
jgi:serine protease Do